MQPVTLSMTLLVPVKRGRGQRRNKRRKNRPHVTLSSFTETKPGGHLIALAS